MPQWICTDCGYEGRDKYNMEKHMKRKYPCKSICIASKEKLEIKKISKIIKEDFKEKEKDMIEYEMKIDDENLKLKKI